MIVKVYAVYDSKVETYLPPFCQMTNAAAIREFSDRANTPNHQWQKHPEDYSLFCIGSFDDQTGVIDPLQPHVTLGKAIEYVKQS